MSTGPDDPFQRVRARALFAVVALCVLAVVLPYRWAAGVVGSIWAETGVVAGLYLTAIPVLAFLCRRAGVDLSRLAGPRPPARELLRTAALALPVVALSVGSIWIVYLPLSYLAPELVELMLLDDWSLLMRSEEGHPFGPNAVLFVSICLLAPLAEEFLFRGLLLHRWTLRMGLRRAIFLSSLLFGVAHADILGSVVFGLVAATLYLETRSLYHPIVLHAANNGIAFAAALLEIALGQEGAIDIESFRGDSWQGALGLAVGVPWAVHFFRTRWRPETWRLPHAAPSTPGS